MSDQVTATTEPITQSVTPVVETAKTDGFYQPKVVETVKTEPAKAPSPVSTTKPSIISDAGKPPATAASTDKSIIDGAKTEGEEVAKKEGEADPSKPAIPEKYEIIAPEGMTLDEAKIAEFTPIAKELGLTNEGVQKLVDYQAKQIEKNVSAQAQAFEDFKSNTRNEAVEFFGPKLAGELPYVAKARDSFFSKETVELLEAAGLTNHKSVISDFAKIGRAFSEDKLVEGKTVTPEDTRSAGQIIYAKNK